MPPSLTGDGRQQLQGLKILRLLGKNLATNPLGLGKIAGSVMLGGVSQSLIDRRRHGFDFSGRAVQRTPDLFKNHFSSLRACSTP